MTVLTLQKFYFMGTVVTHIERIRLDFRFLFLEFCYSEYIYYTALKYNFELVFFGLCPFSASLYFHSTSKK